MRLGKGAGNWYLNDLRERFKHLGLTCSLRIQWEGLCVWCVCVCWEWVSYLTWGLSPMGDPGIIIRILNTSYGLNKRHQVQIYLTGLLNQKIFLVTMCFLNGEIPRVQPVCEKSAVILS